jgi:hypothetical protein
MACASAKQARPRLVGRLALRDDRLQALNRAEEVHGGRARLGKRTAHRVKLGAERFHRRGVNRTRGERQPIRGGDSYRGRAAHLHRANRFCHPPPVVVLVNHHALGQLRLV